MAEPLTQLERNVYHYMLDFLAENAYQPSIREIARRFRIRSTKTVADVLGALETKGFIQRAVSRSRGVRLLGFAGVGATQPVPYYDNIQASDPAILPDHRKGFITLDRRFLPGDDVFIIRARDASMVGRGIFDGDYVMISPSAPAKDGDIVVARFGGSAGMRTVRHRGATLVLEPGIDSEPTIELGPGDDFAILGVVCGVFRPFVEQEPTPLLAAETLTAG